MTVRPWYAVLPTERPPRIGQGQFYTVPCVGCGVHVWMEETTRPFIRVVIDGEPPVCRGCALAIRRTGTVPLRPVRA